MPSKGNPLGLPILAVLAFAGTLSGQMGGYTGPSILSRGGGGGVTPSAPIALRPYLNLNFYATSLGRPDVDTSGQVPDKTAIGGEAALGLYGYHGWKRTVIGVNYRGDFRRYSQEWLGNQTDHFLSFGVTHRPSQHISVSLRQGAGTFTQNYGYLGSFGFFDPSFAQIPQDELLDTRTTYFTTMADVTYLKSARLSFNFGGTEFQVRRRASALYGVTGTSARGDTAYRVTRRTTIGADYFFSHFGFNKAFGAADLHSAGFNYSVQLTRWWQVAFRAGAIRTEILSAGTVKLDPLIAAITGQTEAARAFYTVKTKPAFNAQISRTFRHATASAGYTYGASPGNGIYLTAQQSSASGQYTYTGMRHWSLSAMASYSEMRGVGQDVGRYRAASAGGGIARSISSRNLFFTARFDVRRYTVGQSFARLTHYTSVGLAYSPGDVPLRLW